MLCHGRVRGGALGAVALGGGPDDRLRNQQVCFARALGRQCSKRFGHSHHLQVEVALVIHHLLRAALLHLRTVE